MFLSILLVAQAALPAGQAGITPAQYERAHRVARAVLSERCSDGLEHLGVVTAGDGAFRDLMTDSTATTSTLDNELFKPLCGKSPLISYHCHPARDSFSRFPGVEYNGRASDFTFAAQLEYLCGIQSAEKGAPYSQIEHFLISADGALVKYGIRGEYLDRIRSLSRQMAEATALPQFAFGAGNMPQLGNISGLGRSIGTVGAEIHDLYGLMNAEYGGMVQLFLKNTCPDAKNDDDVRACRGFSLEAFVQTLDPCGGYTIVPPKAKGPRPCTVGGERIALGGQRFVGWTELTPQSYESFTKEGRVVLAFCDGSGSERAIGCGTLLSEMEKKLPTCRALKQGYVDVSRYPELRSKHTDTPQSAALLDDGRRYEIAIRDASPQILKLIICGTESLFSGFTN